MSVSTRTSQRATKGLKPARYRSHMHSESLDEATRKRRVAEAELRAAEEEARLRREALKIDLELNRKRLALEQAQADEEQAAIRGSNNSLAVMSDSVLARKKTTSRHQKQFSDTELLSMRSESRAVVAAGGGSPALLDLSTRGSRHQESDK